MFQIVLGIILFVIFVAMIVNIYFSGFKKDDDKNEYKH